MTTNQLAYQANLEKERSNRANELISSITAYANQQNARTNERKLTFDAQQAEAALRQAQAAVQNAQSNTLTANANMRNAYTNERNASTLSREADIKYQQMLGQLGRWAVQNTTDKAGLGSDYLGSLGTIARGLGALLPLFL